MWSAGRTLELESAGGSFSDAYVIENVNELELSGADEGRGAFLGAGVDDVDVEGVVFDATRW